jgi:hypothetical protein
VFVAIGQYQVSPGTARQSTGAHQWWIAIVNAAAAIKTTSTISHTGMKAPG